MAGLFTQRDSSPSTSPKARPMPASSFRAESHLSGSPSRASSTARLAETPGSPSTRGQIPIARHSRSQSNLDSDAPLAGASGTSVPGPGPSSLSQALRGSMGRSPPRFANASQADSFRQSSPGRRAPIGDISQLGGSPRPSEDLEVLRRHLVGKQPGSPSSSYRTNNGFPGTKDQEQPAADEEDFSSLQLQGGDTTRHIYRYAEKREKEQQEAEQRESGRMRRSMSVYLPRDEEEDTEIANIQMPGGFRRHHIKRTAASPAPSSINPRQREYGTLVGEEQVKPAPPKLFTNNFIEFLTLYGHFAGEDLDEDDEVLGPDEYFSSDAYDDATTDAGDRRSDDGWGEDSALLTPGKRKRKRKTKEAGTGSPMGAAMLLLKSFVGTGVLFLPRAYLNGGMMFSNLVLLAIAILSYYCFILLVNTRLKVKASFGDMGGLIYGKHFRNMINFSLVISQIGFSSAYIVFVGENLQAFIEAVSHCKTSIDIKWVILMQMVIFLPLSLYRNINHIQKMALAADLFILLGLIYIYFYDVKTIVHNQGISDIQNFNPKDWTLFIGTAIFTFEGIGLIIPIQGGMKDPKKFPTVLASVMAIVSVCMISIGALSYAAYGSHTKTVVLSNMRQDNKLVNGVQFIYSVAILLSTPLQIYPAIEITSQQLFSRTGKYNPWIKWKKNVFRFFMVMLCAMIAWLGANDLDKFVSIVGSFACIPLVYIYPPLMHYRAVATRPWQKVADILLVIIGFVAMAYTTGITAISWASGHSYLALTEDTASTSTSTPDDRADGGGAEHNGGAPISAPKQTSPATRVFSGGSYFDNRIPVAQRPRSADETTVSHRKGNAWDSDDDEDDRASVQSLESSLDIWLQQGKEPKRRMGRESPDLFGFPSTANRWEGSVAYGQGAPVAAEGAPLHWPDPLDDLVPIQQTLFGGGSGPAPPPPNRRSSLHARTGSTPPVTVRHHEPGNGKLRRAFSRAARRNSDTEKGLPQQAQQQPEHPEGKQYPPLSRPQTVTPRNHRKINSLWRRSIGGSVPPASDYVQPPPPGPAPIDTAAANGGSVSRRDSAVGTPSWVQRTSHVADEEARATPPPIQRQPRRGSMIEGDGTSTYGEYLQTPGTPGEAAQGGASLGAPNSARRKWLPGFGRTSSIRSRAGN